jgi:hypothetical protein
MGGTGCARRRPAARQPPRGPVGGTLEKRRETGQMPALLSTNLPVPVQNRLRDAPMTDGGSALYSDSVMGMRSVSYPPPPLAMPSVAVRKPPPAPARTPKRRYMQADEIFKLRTQIGNGLAQHVSLDRGPRDWQRRAAGPQLHRQRGTRRNIHLCEPYRCGHGMQGGVRVCAAPAPYLSPLSAVAAAPAPIAERRPLRSTSRTLTSSRAPCGRCSWTSTAYTRASNHFHTVILGEHHTLVRWQVQNHAADPRTTHRDW